MSHATAASRSPAWRGVSGPGSRESAPARSRDTAALTSSLRAGAFAQPERHRRRLALRIGDAHDTAADAQDAPRRVAELENVARQRLDREVFVERAEERAFGLEQHAVVEHFGNRAAAHDRRHARAFARAHFLVDRIVVHERGAPAAALVW